MWFDRELGDGHQQWYRHEVNLHNGQVRVVV
jgi:DNA relaxase NicK